MSAIASSSGISLLPREVRETRRQKNKEKKQRNASLIVLGIVLLLSGASYGVTYYLDGNISSLNQAIQQEKNNIASLSEVEELIKSFAARLQAMTQLFAHRSYYSTLLTTFADITPSEISLSSVNVSGKVVKVSGNATDYVSLAKFISNATLESKGGSVFSGAELSGVSLDKRSGGVQFSANLTLRSDGLQKKNNSL